MPWLNLAGAPISERWSDEHKRAIVDSRVVGTQKLVAALAQADPKPSVWVNASAIGYYGTSETETFDEASQPVEDDFSFPRSVDSGKPPAQQVKNYGPRLVIFSSWHCAGHGGRGG